MSNDQGKCAVCNENMTNISCEISDKLTIHVCKSCIDKAEENFIWVCVNCGKSYLRPKGLVIKRVKNVELKQAYMVCKDMKIIQGIDMCISCDPQGILNHYFEESNSGGNA